MDNDLSQNIDLNTRPEVTAAVTKGAGRLLASMGYAVLLEFRLKNNRRADLCGVNKKGEIVIVEVKSCREDFEVDTKWGDYLEFCDRYYFAVAEDFPIHLLPEDEGLIVADGFFGAVVKDAETRKMAAARRKAVTLRFARQAAFRANGQPSQDDE